MRRVILVAGARPNFMKVAPLSRALAERGVPTQIVHTGQHYDAGMSDVFFEQLGIPAPDVHLAVGSATHGEQTARILERFEAHLLSMKEPAGVVVVGDVNSTLACTLAAVKLGIPVAHVEAGLRSFDRSMPEEINRIVTDAIADLLFVSEPAGLANLEREGVAPKRIHYAGNVMIDTLVHELARARQQRMAERLGLSGRPYALVTLHRPSNVDDAERLGRIVTLLERTSALLALVLPLHPRTAERVERYGLGDRLRRVATLLDPLGYHETLGLLAGATAVITDSGGVQEETTYLDVPCLTLRQSTERPITVSRGTNTLVGGDPEAALPIIGEILEGKRRHAEPIRGWDGKAGHRIAEKLAAWS